MIGTAVAVGLSKIVGKWRLGRVLFLLPYAVPHVAVALIWLSLFTPTLSPINAFFDLFGITVPTFLTTQNGAMFAIVVADTWTNFPFTMLIILAALQGISTELDEAAALDGATRVKAFIFITLPLLIPALLMVSLFRFIDSLKHFPMIFVITKGGPGRSTQATNFYAYVQTFQNSNVAYGAAIAVFLFVFAAVISLLCCTAQSAGVVVIDNSTSYRAKKALGVGMMLVLLGFAALPTLWVLILSIREQSAIFEPIWESRWRSLLDNFFSITRSDFPRALMNSFITAGSSTALAMLVGVPAGFALAKSRVSAKFLASWILLLLRMAPPVGFVIPLFLLYVNAGLIDTYAGLIAAYMTLTLPLIVWSMWNSFSQVPDELVEAAIMDGASLAKAFLLVALPIARPGAVAAAILGFLIAMERFLLRADHYTVVHEHRTCCGHELHLV